MRRGFALLGGTFDPVHRGHLALAEAALEALPILRVDFLPAGDPWQKKRVTSAFHRVTMLRHALQYDPRFRVDEREVLRPGKTYTIDTLGELERRWPDVRFAMLVGTDIVGQIERWKQWEEIVSRYKIYVYPRRGYAGDGDARFEALAGEPFEDFSSTEVRRALASGDTDMVPEAVRNYIKEHKLWITQKKSPD